MPPTCTARRRAARTLLAAAVVTVLAGATTAATPAPAPVPVAESTVIVGWERHQTRTADQSWVEQVAVTPARGRELRVQQQVDGEWVTRRTVTLGDGRAEVVRIDVPRQWTHEPETFWRLSLPGAPGAAPATSPVRRMSASWELSTDPRDLPVLVNKAHPVEPADWEPQRLVEPDMPTSGAPVQLRPVAANALDELGAAVQEATGERLVLVSGFRSAAQQERLYHRYASRDGSDAADQFSARAGHSEHQTGLAADVTQDGVSLTQFGGTPSSDWVAENAWRYGFVVRYVEGNEDITGYAPEPWHLRYVGPDLAAYLNHTRLTLEEAVGAEPAPEYVS